MAVVRPFKAIRPNPNVTDRVAALPYDVYNRAEATVEAKREPLSFLCIDRAETQLADEIDTYDPCVYEKANSLMQERISDGTFIQDEKPCFYIYELIMDGRSQTGIVACASIDDYISGVIKKHENTREDKEIDRINHVDSLSAQTGPIFLAYRNNAQLKNIIDDIKKNPSLFDFTSSDGITHRGWIVDAKAEIDSIQEVFGDIDNIYIADGHHRCASACKVGLKRRQEHKNYTGQEEFNYFLSVLFADEELMILDYNRVVKDLNGHSASDIIASLESLGSIECKGTDAVKPSKKGEFGVFLDNNWYKFNINDELIPNDPVEGLDVSVLQKNVLEPVFGIKEPRTDKRIDFVGGIRGLKELERRVNEDCEIAFSMYPTSILELFEVADANLLMPPKSTWFEPKLRSGLFIHEIER